jgi:ABC-type branched-subunit amino acid transport system ATPase component
LAPSAARSTYREYASRADQLTRGYVLQTGRVVLEGTSRELLGSELVRKAYLGI